MTKFGMVFPQETKKAVGRGFEQERSLTRERAENQTAAWGGALWAKDDRGGATPLADNPVPPRDLKVI